MQEAIDALSRGEQDRAFKLLCRHLAAHPDDASGWLWLSEATDDPRKKLDALDRVLKLDPNHPRASGIVQRIEAIKADSGLPPVPVTPRRTPETPRDPASGELNMPKFQTARLGPIEPPSPEPEREELADIDALLASPEARDEGSSGARGAIAAEHQPGERLPNGPGSTVPGPGGPPRSAGTHDSQRPLLDLERLPYVEPPSPESVPPPLPGSMGLDRDSDAIESGLQPPLRRAEPLKAQAMPIWVWAAMAIALIMVIGFIGVMLRISGIF